MSRSSPKIDLRPASPAHIGRIATRLRAVDRAECCAFFPSAKAGLRSSLLSSVEAVTAFVDDRPEAMFGVSPINALEGRGTVWFLGTDMVARCASALMLAGPGLIQAMHLRFRRLENMVSVENAQAIRMLRRWGFEMGSSEVIVGGVAFLPFWRDADVR